MLALQKGECRDEKIRVHHCLVILFHIWEQLHCKKIGNLFLQCGFFSLTLYKRLLRGADAPLTVYRMQVYFVQKVYKVKVSKLLACLTVGILNVCYSHRIIFVRVVSCRDLELTFYRVEPAFVYV